jgi:3-deoxy-manno-octulosonate cytidylyltransferase (CMP-KDO synthetase)
MKGRKICVISPARLNSSRFPRKPLVDIRGKSMIQRVYERCKETGADEIIISTEDQEIYDHVTKFGKCDLTPQFQNGTLIQSSQLWKLQTIQLRT